MSEKWQVVLELWRAVCYDKGKSERGMQMNSQQRRQQLLVLLRIVGDVALLRAAGEQISATPRGYVLKQEQNLQTRTIACRHDDEHLLQELYIAVDNGCAVLDVTVEHPIYGQISGQLQVFSRYDADQFYHKLTTTNAPPLCALTGGVHLHTIQFQHEEDFERVVSRLREEGILFSE